MHPLEGKNSFIIYVDVQTIIKKKFRCGSGLLMRWIKWFIDYVRGEVGNRHSFLSSTNHCLDQEGKLQPQRHEQLGKHLRVQRGREPSHTEPAVHDQVDLRLRHAVLSL